MDDDYGAISTFNKYLKVDPNNYVFLVYRAISKGKIGDFKGGLFDLNKAIEIEPDKAEEYFYFTRALFKSELKDYYGAISDYIKAIEINPKYEKAYINRGRSFYSINDEGNACKDFKKAVFLGSTATEEWLNSEVGSWCRNM